MAKKEIYRSRVYTERPAYADFDAPAKFTAIQSIIAKRLYEHPNAICSYSGGADSDIMVHLIERTRKLYGFPPIKYVFFNTGLEMKAIKDHVKYTSEKYGIEIEEVRPKIGIVQASRKYGVPFVSKIMSAGLTRTGCCGCPISYKAVEDLEKIRPYEPNVVKAAWNIFGKSYEYRKRYNAYKEERKRREEEAANEVEGQMSIYDFIEVLP